MVIGKAIEVEHLATRAGIWLSSKNIRQLHGKRMIWPKAIFTSARGITPGHRNGKHDVG
jgi:hypothetical protein